VHVAPVQADDDRQIGARQLLPRGLAAVDEAAALLAELVLQALRDGLGLQTHGAGVQRAPERQHFGEQLGRQPVLRQRRCTLTSGHTEGRID